MDYLEYKGYKGSVEYSLADKCFYGNVLGLSKDGISYEGATPEELEADFRAGIDDYLEGCKAHGIKPRKPYSGKMQLRMTPALHGRIAVCAAEQGTSINSFINATLEAALRSRTAL